MKALDALRRYGWVTGTVGSKEEGFCSIGAINFAYKGSAATKRAKTREKLAQYVSKRYPGFTDYTDEECVIIDWNDDTQRTKRQVLAAFRAIKV